MRIMNRDLCQEHLARGVEALPDDQVDNNLTKKETEGEATLIDKVEPTHPRKSVPSSPHCMPPNSSILSVMPNTLSLKI